MRTVEPGYPTPFGIYRVDDQRRAKFGFPIEPSRNGIFLYFPVFAIYGKRYAINIDAMTRGWWLITARIRLAPSFTFQHFFVPRGTHVTDFGDEFHVSFDRWTYKQ